jgi:hypothetical protein
MSASDKHQPEQSPSDLLRRPRNVLLMPQMWIPEADGLEEGTLPSVTVAGVSHRLGAFAHPFHSRPALQRAAVSYLVVMTPSRGV